MENINIHEYFVDIDKIFDKRLLSSYISGSHTFEMSLVVKSMVAQRKKKLSVINLQVNNEIFYL